MAGCFTCAMGKHDGHQHVWQCPECTHRIKYLPGDYHLAETEMMAHIQQDHPQHYENILEWTALSSD